MSPRVAVLTAVVTFGLAFAIGVRAPAASAASYHCNQVNLHPSSLAVGTVGASYNQHIWFTPATAYFCYWNVTGLPSGLSFVPGPQPEEGYIQGTPTQSGSFPVTIGDGCVYLLGAICPVNVTFTLTVHP